VCGQHGAQGLEVAFRVCADGRVVGRFACRQAFQGYDGFMHGGIISLLLDGAMTNCLFARGKTAVTGELTVRFLFPVVVNREAVVSAWSKASCLSLHQMESELIQDGRVVAQATAKFMEVPDANLAAGSV